MRFTAKILECTRESTLAELGKEKGFQIFKFSRTKIWFTKRQESKGYFLSLFAVCPFQNEANYTFDKVYDKDEKKRWKITIAGGNHCDSFLEINWWNKIKCNIIHKRYLFQRDPDWFWKTLIAAGIGFAFALIANGIGYRQGFRDGVKSTKQQTPDTTQKRQ